MSLRNGLLIHIPIVLKSLQELAGYTGHGRSEHKTHESLPGTTDSTRETTEGLLLAPLTNVGHILPQCPLNDLSLCFQSEDLLHHPAQVLHTLHTHRIIIPYIVNYNRSPTWQP